MLGLTVFVLCGALLNLCQGCNKNISVEVTYNGAIELPYVYQVILWSKQDVIWTVAEDTCTRRSTSKSFMINPCKPREDIFAKIGDRNYTINLTFSEDKISCENITLDVEVNETESFNFTCIPVSSCNNSADITISSINWKIGYSQDDNFTDLIEGPYAPPGSSPEANKNIVSFTDGTIKNNILQITGMTYYSVGFYKVMNESDEDDNTVLHTFIIYYGPMIISNAMTSTVIYDSSTAYRYDDLYCVFRSFPSAVVSWTFDSNRMISDNGNYDFVNITESNRNVTFQSDNIDLTWTINGGLIINQVQYEDSGTFYCNANNGYETTSGSIRLRVRNPLRPLWPALGIIASFVITAVFIVAGYIVDKVRGEKVTVDPDEINGALRRLSVSSEDDVRESLHYRRNSSSKEIIVNQS